uniref:WW domain-containing protein n=1 Tax=Alexandrium catenella TaxID=2925 RepID=A0A7S1RSC8_ALECA|mmetsp:Transcript_71248/g.189455  ORF Transcript_71248/g.189455 Transcript_71248/m.189455 type:complete len:558 (+) Transcript_71248:74-1747(+)
MVQQWVKVPGDKPYYWNLETQETSWSEPAGPDVAWVVQRTAEGGMYYWNKKTDETTWDTPFATSATQRKTTGRRAARGTSDEENDPWSANAPVGQSSTRLGWKAHQTPEGFAYRATPDLHEPLSSWPHMEGRAILAHETGAGGPIAASPMMIVHALKPSNPAGNMVSFTDGRMMMKLPSCMGGATLVPMQGSAAKLKALAKGKSGPTVEAADHLGSRWAVKGGSGSSDGGMLAQSGMWDINRLQELNCKFVDPSALKKRGPLSMTNLQIEAIKTLDGTSASFLPGCLGEPLPFSCAAERYAYFEEASIDAATKRMDYMRSRGLVAASMRVAAKLLSYSWTPGIVSSDWKPYMRPKTLQPWREKTGGKLPAIGFGAAAAAAGAPWWEQQAAGGAAARGPPPEMGKAKADALSAAALLASVRNTVLDILGGDMIEDDTSLFHAGVNAIKPVTIRDNLQALSPVDFTALPDYHHELTTGFEPPAPSQEAALAKAGEKAAAGESEKGCRATATRIRSSASSFYTLMGSTAADYSTMALNIPQGGAGRGPGLSASPFTAALG